MAELELGGQLSHTHMHTYTSSPQVRVLSVHTASMSVCLPSSDHGVLSWSECFYTNTESAKVRNGKTDLSLMLRVEFNITPVCNPRLDLPLGPVALGASNNIQGMFCQLVSLPTACCQREEKSIPRRGPMQRAVEEVPKHW